MRIRKMRFINLCRFATLFTLLIYFCFISMPLFAQAETKVYDYANLFTLEEIENLETSATQVAEKYQMDIGIITTNDAEGKSAQDYADDFYDDNGYGYGSNLDGLLFLIDMDNREIYISTCGLGIQYFTDLRISKMLDSAYNYVSKEDYYGSALDFIQNVETNINKGIPSDQQTVDKDFSDPRVDYNNSNIYEAPSKHVPFRTSSGQPLNPRSIALSVGVAALAAAIIAFIVRSIVQYTYKHPRYTIPPTRPDDLSVHYTEKEDRFVTSHTSRVKIQTNNDSGHGGGHGGGGGISSSHHSSSGQSHGGGGRGF